MADAPELTGRCLCGAVRMTARHVQDRVGACHCGMCQKWGGGPLLTIECDVRFDGGDDIAVYDSSEWAERGFCRKCGSHLFYHLKASARFEVPVGLLERADGLVFDEQIFIEEKPAFYSFAEDTKTLTGAEAFARYAKPE